MKEEINKAGKLKVSQPSLIHIDYHREVYILLQVVSAWDDVSSFFLFSFSFSHWTKGVPFFLSLRRQDE